MSIKIALAGNPNCGKTTLFNELTGSNQYVGNWPGVTVEKKEGKLKGYQETIIVDLPGIYSLSPYTLEEVVTRNYLIDTAPDVIINLVDASNLERNLYLTTQLIEMGIPVVIALNMIDIVQKNGDSIDSRQLESSLGCPVIETSALKNIGIKELVEKAIAISKEVVGTKDHKKPVLVYSKKVEQALQRIEEICAMDLKNNLRYFTIKLFERDEKAQERLSLHPLMIQGIEDSIVQTEKALGDDSESIITSERYEYIDRILKHSYTRISKGSMSPSDRIDRILTNRWLALPIFAMVMWFIYYISVTWLGTITTDWTNEVFFGEIVPNVVSNFLVNAGVAAWLQSLILDGFIGGVGAVLGFVPQIMILFLLIAFLEDCGYMARVAFIMDRVFRKFGLSGKSFIPMLIGSGCSVPAVMASRTIENENDRRMTIILTPFIPCSAKLPIFALFVGAFFPTQSWIAPSMYFVGIGMVILSGILLKKTSLFSGDPAPFVMELPQYHMPNLKSLILHMWDRVKSFITKAGTVIFVGCGAIWFLQTFNWQLQMVEANQSILATLGSIIAPIFAPLGFGNWQAAVATIAGFTAKENIVATFGVLFGINGATEETSALLGSMTQLFTPVSAYAFMIFNLLAAPCFAAMGTMKRELGSWKWTLIAIGYQTGLAYVAAMIVYQVGSAIFLGTQIQETTAILIVFTSIVSILFASSYLAKKKKLISQQNF